MAWEPIETAPKNDESVDLWVVTRTVESDGSVHDYSARRIPNAHWLANEKLSTKGAWCTYDDADEDADEHGNLRIDHRDKRNGPGRRTVATHWMPIPKGPAGERSA